MYALLLFLKNLCPHLRPLCIDTALRCGHKSSNKNLLFWVSTSKYKYTHRDLLEGMWPYSMGV